ncbi:MAG: GDP-mannose 4,6-dehydratase [Isosphaeraceae bacterium]
MRVLITGITGFVGRHLTRHLAASGDVIWGLSTSGQWPEEYRGELSRLARLERVDLADSDCMDTLVEMLDRRQPEAIYHLAAQSNPQASMDDPRGSWAVNLGGTLNLLESVRESNVRPRVLVVSSGVVYGNPAPERIPVREDCPEMPINPYSASKVAADMHAIQCHLGYGLNTIIARPFNHAGPGQSPRYVLANLALQAAEIVAGVKPGMQTGNLNIIRDFTDVRDIVRGYRMLVEKGRAGEIYHLGRGHGTKLFDALEALRKISGHAIPQEVDPARLRGADLELLVADVSKIYADTGWQAEIPLEQTMKDLFEGFLKTIIKE